MATTRDEFIQKARTDTKLFIKAVVIASLCGGGTLLSWIIFAEAMPAITSLLKLIC